MRQKRWSMIDICILRSIDWYVYSIWLYTYISIYILYLVQDYIPNQLVAVVAPHCGGILGSLQAETRGVHSSNHLNVHLLGIVSQSILIMMYHTASFFFWANHNNSPWNVGPFWDDSPITTMIPGFGKTGFGRYNLPRHLNSSYMFIPWWPNKHLSYGKSPAASGSWAIDKLLGCAVGYTWIICTYIYII